MIHSDYFQFISHLFCWSTTAITAPLAAILLWLRFPSQTGAQKTVQLGRYQTSAAGQSSLAGNQFHCVFLQRVGVSHRFFFSFNVSWCTQFLPAHHGGRHHGTRVAITRSFSVFRQGPSWNTQRKWNLKNGRNDGRLARTHAMFDFVTIKVGADFVATPLDGSIRSIWKKKKFGPFF